MVKGILSQLVVTLFVFAASVGGSVCLYVYDMLVYGTLLLIIAILAFVYTLRIFARNNNKATFMFNAIENDDFTFRFAERGLSDSDSMYNSSLNRIKDIMQKTRLSIAQREKYYETIIDNSTSGLIVIEPKLGVIFQYNRAAQDMLCVGTMTHVNQLSVISPEIPEVLLGVNPSENRSVSFYNETVKVCLNISASMVWLNGKELKIVSMSDIGGQIDNTQTESWVRLSRVLTHEIMNSLAPITSLSEQLKTTTDPEILHRGLEIIGTTGKGLIEFVDSYRSVTRIPIPIIGEVSIIEMLHQIISLFDVVVDVSGVDNTLVVQADENLITQVLTNLIKNAKEATQSGGRIWVVSRVDVRGRVVVEVCNSGEQIPVEIRDNIFVPFFTTKHGGSGIGLSISRQIMRMHNGTLTYANVVKGGQNVTVFLLHF